jgi:hypothetical protein
MSSDQDSLDSLKASPPSDFISLLGGMFSGIRCKFLVLLFVFFLLISSDVFVDRVLSKVDSAVNMDRPTSYGTVIQGMLLVMCVLVLDVLTNRGAI